MVVASGKKENVNIEMEFRINERTFRTIRFPKFGTRKRNETKQKKTKK